jgi:hypothetical protein
MGAFISIYVFGAVIVFFALMMTEEYDFEQICGGAVLWPLFLMVKVYKGFQRLIK